MKSKTDPRHAARELALTSIFSWLFSEQGGDESLELSREVLDLNEDERQLLAWLVDGVKTNLDAIDQLIQRSAPDWPLDKISKVDLVILRIAVFEVVFGKDTPAKVAIDEAVELGKEFGNDTSSKFINGVLGHVVESQQEKN